MSNYPSSRSDHWNIDFPQPGYITQRNEYYATSNQQYPSNSHQEYPSNSYPQYPSFNEQYPHSNYSYPSHNTNISNPTPSTTTYYPATSDPNSSYLIPNLTSNETYPTISHNYSSWPETIPSASFWNSESTYPFINESRNIDPDFGYQSPNNFSLSSNPQEESNRLPHLKFFDHQSNFGTDWIHPEQNASHR